MEDKKILIIGGGGFIGSNIMHWIDQHGLPYVVDTFGRSVAQNKFKCIRNEYLGEFTNPHIFNPIFEASDYDYVFHCLSTSTPSVSNSNIRNDVEANLIPTLNLLDCLRNKKSTLVFFSSGGAIYGSDSKTLHKETDLPNPISSYGVVKNTIEQYIRIYSKLYNVKHINLRISNPFGLYHKSNSQGIINIAIRKSLRNELVEVWGDGNNRKDYIYALDIPRILFQLLSLDKANFTLNLGSGTGVSINQIINHIRKIIGDIKVSYIDSKVHDVPEFILDTDNMNALISTTSTSLEDGLTSTYRWEQEKLGLKKL